MKTISIVERCLEKINRFVTKDMIYIVKAQLIKS